VRMQVFTAPLHEMRAALLGMRPRIRQAHARTAFVMGTKAVRIARTKYRGAPLTTDIATHSRTGKLRAQYASDVLTDADGVTLNFGALQSGAALLSYFRIHEFGGTIRAKSGHSLAIPLDAAKTAAGVARGGPRDFANTFLLKRDGKPPLIMQRQGTAVVSLFVLVKSVTIKPRPALEPTRREIQPELEQRAVADVERVLGGKS
jgi:hypothetical protein